MNEAQEIVKFLNMVGQTVIRLINHFTLFKEMIVLDKVSIKDRTITISWK